MAIVELRPSSATTSTTPTGSSSDGVGYGLCRRLPDCYVFKLENDAEVTDTISVHGCPSTADFANTYTLGGIDVTAAVEAGTQQFSLQPGKRTIALKIDAAPGVASGLRSCAIAATLGDEVANSDIVVAQLSIG